MFKIVIIHYGLGNQMFGYAFYLVLKRRFKFSFIQLEPLNCTLGHYGFELPIVFPNIKQKRSNKYYRRIQKIYSIYFTKKLFKKVVDQESCDFYPDYAKNYPFVVYEGFWETEKYFKHIKNIIFHAFQFDEEKLNIQTIEQRKIFEQENSVSIHIRQGDYNDHQELGGICTPLYYKNAIHFIENHVSNPIFYIFTDDREYVISNLSFLHYKIIDWNILSDSWQDMYLMTKCKHNIIANSTFSWWGAWLNKNNDKIVIAPSKWLQTRSAKDIFPENWTRINTE